MHPLPHRTFVFLLLIALSFGLACPTLWAEEDKAESPKPELLWPEGTPGIKDFKPTLTTFLADPAKANGVAVVVCPGGGYGGVCMEREGVATAEWLNSIGISAFVVNYRNRGNGYGHPAPLQDAQRAMRIARSRAEDLKIDPNRIGIMGFSAGGHLASSAGTHFDKGNPDATDPIEKVSCRPDFMILCYPVIAFGEPFTHVGSQHNLLGQDADAKLVEEMSSEKQVTSETPPTFLFSMNEDKVVPSENAVSFYMALRKAKVPAELHIYEKGIHGSGGYYRVDTGVKTWFNQCENWLRDRGIIPAK